MPLFWSLLIAVFGLILAVVAATSFRRYTQFVLFMVGVLLMVFGGTHIAAYDKNQQRKSKADFVARTITVRGMVDVKEERWSLKSPAPKKGGYLCFITLKELPYTFALSGRGRGGICNDIKIRDIVRVKFVQPVDNELYVDALEFVDLTYELNIYNVYKAIYQPVEAGRDSQGAK